MVRGHCIPLSASSQLFMPFAHFYVGPLGFSYTYLSVCVCVYIYHHFLKIYSLQGANADNLFRIFTSLLNSETGLKYASCTILVRFCFKSYAGLRIISGDFPLCLPFCVSLCKTGKVIPWKFGRTHLYNPISEFPCSDIFH